MGARVPAWAEWRPASRPFTVGVEEEVMLLVPGPWSLWQGSEDVVAALPPALARHLSVETHASALELATGVHRGAASAVHELGALRAWLAGDLGRMGLAAAAAGTHPFTVWHETLNSRGERYRLLYRSLRELARREPTFSLHVHVGVPEPEDAVRALCGLREHVPLLLALSANSPFWQGRDTGLASMRAPLFGAFPRVGTPRAFRSYADYVEAVDGLITCGAIPEPTFIWWDVRLQPSLGTIELRIMDAQIALHETAALVALAQCLVRLAIMSDERPARILAHPELLAENRFIAARDGMDAELIGPDARGLVPARALLDRLVERVLPHAHALGCAGALGLVPALARSVGAERQRALAARTGSLRGLVEALAGEFAATAAPEQAPPTATRAPAVSRAA